MTERAKTASAPPTARATKPEPRPEPHDLRAPLWVVRGRMDRGRYIAFALASFFGLLILWELVAAAGTINPLFLPGPLAVVRALIAWWQSGDLWADIGISVWRVMAGFALSAVIAVPLGLYIGAYQPVRALFEPIMEFARYLPAVAFVPLVLLWFGLGESAKISLIWIGTFFQMVLMISEDTSRVPMAQIEAARTLGASNREIIRLVLFRSAMPAMLDTLRITLGFAWTYLVVAELIAANSGLGFAILQAQRYLQTDKIFVGIMLIGIIGLITDQVLRRLHKFLFPWLP
ncbi:MAG: nitrate transport permease nrtB [Acidiphilium sp. 37-64-53]|uniref:ABC transporter permease n=1 Tax=Acidiphilium TaxID=522 RepID=UPI000BCB3BBD|nr:MULTISPECIES: ABC transporter permease [Acidiphilium]OYW02466.1 MAG: nitrate transport permease nrtB [Acidiphilium sp. 37-64-53]OZB30253.1 MAG: nitrate transport permease nrtB [Acidiphilium sp. 34-64-41]HQT84422.1 ABC transporter permease [Acidiphilium rubrum]